MMKNIRVDFPLRGFIPAKHAIHQISLFFRWLIFLSIRFFFKKQFLLCELHNKCILRGVLDSVRELKSPVKTITIFRVHHAQYRIFSVQYLKASCIRTRRSMCNQQFITLELTALICSNCVCVFSLVQKFLNRCNGIRWLHVFHFNINSEFFVVFVCFY